MSDPINRKVSYHNKPDDLSTEEWQSRLRKQFAVEQKFDVINLGEHAVFSDFEVFNPKSKNTYKVSIRDGVTSKNFCSCPDFTINNLGTCKHIEYVLHSLLRYKKYQKIYNNPPEVTYASLSIDYNNQRRIWLKKPNDTANFKKEQDFFDEHGYLFPEKLEQLDVFIKNNHEADHELKIYPDVIEHIDQQKNERKRLEIAARIFDKGIDSDCFNDLIKADLYNYQKQGVIKIFRSGRVLLADEMGLGKTIQAIAAVELFAHHLQVNKVLIICPTSLKFQWKREITKFSGREPQIVEGLVHNRKDMYKKQSFYKIMSYGVAKNDLDLINDWGPELVIIDEAQRIKNWKTKTAQAVKRIESEYAVVLTGTPLENRIDELHSIVEYVDRYRLGPLYKFLDNHQSLDESGKLAGYKNLRTINLTIEPLLIRRTKKEIADQLPGRMDKNFFVEMTEAQKKDHQDYYDIVSQMVNRWLSKGFLSEEERDRLLMALNCMRMVSDNTYILNQNNRDGHKVRDIAALITELMENGDNKIVIFSQWKRMFELIAEELDKLNFKFVYLNGDISAQQRNDIIEKFREDKEIRLFLSTDAGGVGVNLQSANILINVDLPWNPAVLEQRIARIYRLGQKKKIAVYNFITKYSIEHRILYLLDFKKSVFQGVIEEDGDDQVTMDSFMNSVKALTDVDMDGSNGDYFQSYKYGKSGYNDDLANEVNTKVLNGESQPDQYTETKETKPTRKQLKERGMLSKISFGIKNLLGRFFRRKS
ncbi:MAG: DEAD/DEAH box helicase family protein [Bacteroidetes bacterium]|jgi:SNF2 family DNA or RNA helicase|nr:DEAD/DEAH box helicase family protein [Bacteroidota bacterium]